MHRLLTVTVSALITLSLAGCDASETGESSYLDGKKDNCTEVGGAWDAADETCLIAPPEVSQHVVARDRAQHGLVAKRGGFMVLQCVIKKLIMKHI